MMSSRPASCCIVGGGPAGLMLGLLLARAGVAVTVLERHRDFLRDFRGDTVHPSTLTLLDELGLGENLAAVPSVRYIETLTAQLDSGSVTVSDLRRLPGRHRHIALVPQWDFLDVVAAASHREPSYRLIMEADVTDLVRENGRITGVRYRRHGTEQLLTADLVVGCDGRSSTVCAAAGLRPREFGAPIDVEWFRLPRHEGDPGGAIARISSGAMLVLIDRGSYFQVGYLIRKGADAALRAAGIHQFQVRIAAALPWLADRMDTLTSFSEVQLLTVRLSRLRRWSRPGLLLIGDAAHAMSPVGGVGINLAIQDAVAAARVLADPLRRNRLRPISLVRVQARRWLPTALTQAGQRMVHRVFDAMPLGSAKVFGQASGRPPLVARMLRRWPVLTGVPAYLVGIGVLPEHAPQWARR